jgi:hypothetical protein
MRWMLIAALLAPLGLAACGGEKDRTVVVQPPPAQVGTVVTPAPGTKVCPVNTTC